MDSGEVRSLNSQGWLTAIRDADDSTRVGLIEDFHDVVRPVVKRVTATVLRDYAVDRTTWADDVELVVTETLLSLVVDVIAGRDTVSQGHALYSVLLTRSRSRFQRLIRTRAHQDSIGLSSVVNGMRALTSELHLDGPYTVVVKHKISGDTQHVGPFDDIVEALRHSIWVESRLTERGDPEWQATAKPMLSPERIRQWLCPDGVDDC